MRLIFFVREDRLFGFCPAGCLRYPVGLQVPPAQSWSEDFSCGIAFRLVMLAVFW